MKLYSVTPVLLESDNPKLMRKLLFHVSQYIDNVVLISHSSHRVLKLNYMIWAGVDLSLLMA